MTMKAAVQNGYGDPEQVLTVAELPPPDPGPGEVRVRVRASSVNTPDCIATLGVPYVLRPVIAGFSGPSGAVRGTDLAGVVDAVGAGVTDLAVGDEVFGSIWSGAFSRSARGTFCELAVASAEHLVKKPENISFEEAAGAVMSGVTALLAIRDTGRAGPGKRVLINGASGGLGTFAVQIARSLGATVTAVCSGRNAALVRSLGAERVIDYTREDYTRGEARYDLVLDNVLNHPLSASARVLAPGGLLVPNSVGPNRWVGSLPQVAYAKLFAPRRWPTVDFRPSRENLEAMASLLRSGAVKVVIDGVYPLEEAGRAVARMVSKRARGQIVIRS